MVRCGGVEEEIGAVRSSGFEEPTSGKDPFLTNQDVAILIGEKGVEPKFVSVMYDFR